MSAGEASRRSSVFAGALGVLLLAGAVFGLRALLAPAEGPQPLAWDRVRCARCGMLVGEPSFAAQIRSGAGELLAFDDPGCLLLYAHEHADAGEIWLHHAREERWVARRNARFIPLSPTPMAYGLAAVDADEPAALDWDEALRAALDRDTRRAAH